MSDVIKGRARIALVQNQSEMAHYGYADARTDIQRLGYEVQLFTRETLEDLCAGLNQRDWDAIVIGSNALNDREIRARLQGEEFCEAIARHLDSGRGLLCLHQLGLASSDDAVLRFLPPALGEVTALRKGADRRPPDGILVSGPSTESHIALVYPQRIDLKDLTARSLSHIGLPGLYWHDWAISSLAQWERVVIDSEGPADRALMLATTPASPARILCCSLPLDWHQQEAALENVLRYVASGWEATCVVRSGRETAMPDDYLLETLRARRVPHADYPLDDGQPDPHLFGAVHRTVILAPSFRPSSPECVPVAARLEQALAKGEIRVLALEGASLRVRGRDHLTERLLLLTRLQLQAELARGFIGGSFWATIEALTTLEEITPGGIDWARVSGPIQRELIRRRVEDSYDEVLSATAALLWLRIKILPADAIDISRTEAWICTRLQAKCEVRDRLYALATLVRCGRDEVRQLQRAIEGVLAEDSPTELDLLEALRSQRLIDGAQPSDTARRIALQILSLQGPDGTWVDLATTAAITSELLEVYGPRGDLDVPLSENVTVGPSMFTAVSAIHAGRSDQYDTYPWSENPVTTLRCLRAWMLFDRLLESPVDEAVELAAMRHHTAEAERSYGSALSVLDSFRELNHVAQSENEKLKSDLETERQHRAAAVKRFEDERAARPARRRLLVLLGVATAYVVMFLIIGIVRADKTGLATVLDEAFVERWKIHGAVLALVFAFLAVPWKDIIGSPQSKDTEPS